MNNNRHNDQRGSALIISLVMLTAITVVSMVAMQRSSTQIRMINNLQHQHEVANAARGTLSYVYDVMHGDSALQGKIMSLSERMYKNSLDKDDVDIPRFDPFTEFSNVLSQPKFDSKVVPDSGITTSVSALPKPSGNNYYLKAVPGCGTACDVLPAAISTTAVSKNNVITVTQEIGVLRLIPGGA